MHLYGFSPCFLNLFHSEKVSAPSCRAGTFFFFQFVEFYFRKSLYYESILRVCITLELDHVRVCITLELEHVRVYFTILYHDSISRSYITVRLTIYGLPGTNNKHTCEFYNSYQDKNVEFV